MLAVTPAANATGVAITTSVAATFSEAVDPASVTESTFVLRDGAGAAVPVTVNYDAANSTATLMPTSALVNGAAYTVTVRGGTIDPRIKDLAGNPLAGDYTWTFTAVAAPSISCPCSIWDETVTPATASVNDPSAIEVGVKFQSDSAGYITGIRFYKGTNNTGTHVGNLWSSSGQLLATATSTNETASGWQQVNFATPVAIDADTTYVASYHTTVGFYAANSGYFVASGVENPPLRALATGVDGGNGVYQYGASSFPSNSFNGANYWVDVVFELDPQ